ncbi:MAG: hypothetical protein JO235_15620 [Chroococcidiopsidaceae cyanobacterium CP_BM_RX_35]|nr:hypothetical protein [Chroococcidiopsidaceae cyanobacterium CP_BM_RX_35]
MRSFIISAIAFFGIVIALPANADQLYKDPSGAVYISGLQNGQFVQIAYGSLPNTIHPKPQGTCNFLKLPYKNFYPWGNVKVFLPGSSSPIVSFKGSNLKAADVKGTSKTSNLCSGTSRNTSLNWTDLGGGIYGLKNGATQGNSTSVYLIGLPTSASYDAQDITPALRRHKANSCGFIKLTDTPQWPTSKLGTFYYYLGSDPSATYNQSLLSVQAPELCYRGLLYRPN